LNPYQSNLFFTAEYVLSAIIIAFLTWKKTPLDVRRTISRKTLLKRLPIVIITVILSIGLMTGVYLLHLDLTKNLILIGALQLIMTLVSNVILGASWIQRYRVYPRGKELAAVVILMYIIADLFMPSGIKYAILLVGTVLAFIFPNRWEDWE
jgi:small-conductance mechanosensitive channel